MTREEAIKAISDMILDMEYPNGVYHEKSTEDESRKHLALYMAKKALLLVSREQVEKVWRGEWEFDAAEPNGKFGGIRCSKCHAAVSFGGENAFHNAKAFDSFCPFCGAPMTDEAVEMVMERMETINNA